MRFGDGAEPFDDAVLATGFEPALEEFVDVPELLGPVLWWKAFPLTDGRSRSRVHPSIFFPGFDRTPLGGVSLGRWGREAGECIADVLRADGVA